MLQPGPRPPNPPRWRPDGSGRGRASFSRGSAGSATLLAKAGGRRLPGSGARRPPRPSLRLAQAAVAESPHSCTEACAQAWEATLELETPRPPPQSAAGRPFCIPRPRGLGSGWLQVHAPSRLRSSHLAKSPLSSQGLEGARDLGESARLHAAARPRTNF